MSLRLRQAIPGQPSAHSPQNVSTVSTPEKGFIVYRSSSNVVVLDHRLDLVETLQFWSALPHRTSSSSRAQVEGVLGDSKNGLIVAWSGAHLVLWRWTSKHKGKTGWGIHSTLVVGSDITCIDYRNGTLVIGTKDGIESWRMDPSADIVVWDRIWDRPYSGITHIILAPAISHVAWFSKGTRSVFVLTLNRKGEPVGVPQEIRQPREIAWIGWRNSPSSTDAFLYIITVNNIFRVYSPVLDDPAWFQLLSTNEPRSFAAPADKLRASTKGKAVALAGGKGTIWPLDATVVRAAVEAELKEIKEGRKKGQDQALRTLDAIIKDEGDLIMWIGDDSTVAVRSMINLDRKPPTLLKSLPLTAFSTTGLAGMSRQRHGQAQLLTDPSTASIIAVLPPSDLNQTITAATISLAELLSSSPESISLMGADRSGEDTMEVQLSHNIDHFVRTPNGRGLLAMTETGEIGVWYKERLGKIAKGDKETRSIIGKGHWKEKVRPTKSAIFSKGRAIVFYTNDDAGGSITLHHLDHGASSPSPPVTLPDFELDLGDEIELLLAVSDIDDGYSGKGRKTQRAIILAASRQGHAWVWTVDSRLTTNLSTDTNIDEAPDIKLLSHYILPVEGGEPHLILPVDPMGWHQSVIDWKNKTPLQDMILTVSRDGVLEFWSPELGHHFEGERAHCDRVPGKSRAVHSVDEDKPWRRTGLVRTGIEKVAMARCSSRKKTVLVTERSHDCCLELTHGFPPGEKVQDLDWTTTSDLQSVLAVGFAHRVVLVCEQRLSYTETTPGWAPFLTINLEQYTSMPISDSVWLAGGSLAVGAGNQIYTFSRYLDRESPTPSPAPSIKSLALDRGEAEDIFQLIAWQNGPLWDFHPTVLAQCLLWDKIDLVKSILVYLVDQLKVADEGGQKRLSLKRIDPLAFFVKKAKQVAEKQSSGRKYDGLFDAAPTETEEEDDPFSPRVIKSLEEYLQSNLAVPLSRAERLQLVTVAWATLEVERERRSLDKCGLRYLLSVRMAVNHSKRQGLSGTATPVDGTPNGQYTPLPRISFRNFVWATHSESQELLLSAASETCENGKMLWADAKRLGVFLWLKSNDAVKTQLEVVARNRFMADEDRDPTVCSLIFFALGKKKVVHGLWRQAPGHREQAMMLKFLGNDFELERWKTAAVKNAYALLSKQRYEYAAAFFMLGGCPKDAINVCLRQIDDWQLAYALARAVEGGTAGPLVKWVLSDTVVPLAMAGGHRWLATWVFWILGRRDLAVRILISPLDDVVQSWSSEKPLSVGNPENDDPSLLLLFQHLKSKSLQTAKGTSEIPEKTEFDFVLHNARVFFRMGCHSLGLDLLHSWSFDRPFFPSARARSKASTPATTLAPTPTDGRPRRPSLSASGSSSFARPSPRRPSFMLSNHTRRESMVMDMDVLKEGASEPVSRVGSPPTSVGQGVNGHGEIKESVFEEEVEDKAVASPSQSNPDLAKGSLSESAPEIKDEPAPMKKMGNLMKELKQDVQQGGMEFNMDNFF